MTVDLPPDSLKIKALQCLRARLQFLLPNLTTVPNDWTQPELLGTPERYRAQLNDYMRGYIQIYFNNHPEIDPATLNMEVIWRAMTTGRINIVNTNPDLVVAKTLGDGQWAATLMSWVTMPALGLLVMAEALVALETLLG